MEPSSGKANVSKVPTVPPEGYMEHVDRQVATIARLVGQHNGDHYLQEALRSFTEDPLKQP